jgi:arsenate reductase
MAEAILNDLGQGRFRVVSAGQMPADAVNPIAARTLDAAGHSAQVHAPKSLSEFAASAFDLVITVCDNAARCEVGAWAGQPVCVHWSIPSPSELGGDAAAYRRTYETLCHKIEALTALPFEHLSPLERQSAVDRIALDIV